MDLQKQRDFLTRFAYWAIIITGVYLALEYLLPVSVPFLLGLLLVWPVIWISRLCRLPNRIFRICVTILIYGLIGLLITILASRGISLITVIIKWLPEVYELKLLPFVNLCYSWFSQKVEYLDPALLTTLKTILDGVLSGLKNLISSLSGFAVNLVSGLATGIPNLILSALTTIFSTIFVVADYDRIASFTSQNLPQGIKRILTLIREYLTNTLFVVIRSYILIMLLTFTELSILFRVFGIIH